MPEDSPLTLHEFLNPVVHVDCDAFFTSVEQALDPKLRGLPVVTGSERGIVACASYEAKARGVKRPMRLSDARKICPELICLSSDYEAYSLFSRRLFAILRRFTPVVEEFSIDEAFAELSGLRRLFRMDFPDIARRMKETVQNELGLTVSVGLSASKTLAKLASQRQKPDGFTVVPASRLHHFLKTVRVIEVCGFGPNTSALLNKHGIVTAWDYVQRPEAWARKLLGKIGDELWHELRGEAVYPLETVERMQASISKCKTFTPATSVRDFVHAQLVRNTESAFIKLRRHGLRMRGMQVLLRDEHFQTAGVEGVLERPTSSTVEGAHLATLLFDKLFEPGKRYRLTGVVLFQLTAATETQYSLFDDIDKIRSLDAVDRVIDGAAERFGKHALHLATGGWLDKRAQHASKRAELPERKKKLLPGETFRQHLGIPLWKIDI